MGFRRRPACTWTRPPGRSGDRHHSPGNGQQPYSAEQIAQAVREVL
ncbi:putative structural protein [Pseudomonas aeruginosa]|nr:putative structural protein [Pseudomonas aeruginosa]